MRKMKITAIVLCIILTAGVLVGCGSAAIPKPTPGEEVSTVEITGQCSMKVDGSTITVTGETSFITGTLINISVVAQSGMVIDSVTITQTKGRKVEAVFQMSGDKFEDAKEITAYLTVTPKKQPKENVLGEYGEKFEKISNETIWNKDGNIVSFASEPYEL